MVVDSTADSPNQPSHSPGIPERRGIPIDVPMPHVEEVPPETTSPSPPQGLEASPHRDDASSEERDEEKGEAREELSQGSDAFASDGDISALPIPVEPGHRYTPGPIVEAAPEKASGFPAGTQAPSSELPTRRISRFVQANAVAGQRFEHAPEWPDLTILDVIEAPVGGTIAFEVTSGFRGLSNTPGQLRWVFLAADADGPAQMEVVLRVLATPPPPIEQNKTVPNAKVGVPYEADIDLSGAQYVLSSPATVAGLTIDVDGHKITGVPSDSGEFGFTLLGVAGTQRIEYCIRISVIPDPRSLWKDLPTDPSAPFQKPNEDHAQLRGDLLMVAASKRGRSHAHVGSFREDDFGLTMQGPGGWHIAIVADGAGSSRYSRWASQQVVASIRADLHLALSTQADQGLDGLVGRYAAGEPDARNAILKLLYRPMAETCLTAANKLAEFASSMKVEQRDFYSTAIVVATRRVNDGWFVTSFAVGDGAAAVLDLRKQTVLPLMDPDGGEFAGQTRFLVPSELTKSYEATQQRIHFEVVDDFDAIVLMTDGVSDPKFETDARLLDYPVWESFWRDDLCTAVDLTSPTAEISSQLLSWLDFWSQGNHDDRTIALLINEGK